ncbi:MAG: hypothetical protein IT566_02065 [Rhodospirillaceae bacterium]|nr:hypothetical protein [Rhodospirillaceae bacterium]
MGNVIELGTVTAAVIPPEKILQAALKAALTEVVVVGQRPDGTVYFAMSTAEAPGVNWMLDCAKRLLMDGIMEDESHA